MPSGGRSRRFESCRARRAVGGKSRPSGATSAVRRTLGSRNTALTGGWLGGRPGRLMGGASGGAQASPTLGRAGAAIDARAGGRRRGVAVRGQCLARRFEVGRQRLARVNVQVPEVVQPFWPALQRGEFIADAAVQAGTYRKQGTRWVAGCGGARPRRGRNLSRAAVCRSRSARRSRWAAYAARRSARSPDAGQGAVDYLTRAQAQRQPHGRVLGDHGARARV
jgi:hypothetical protein